MSQPEPFPPGHFHSPIHSVEEVRAAEERIFTRPQNGIPGVDLADEDQLALLARLSPLGKVLPYGDSKTAGWRYWYVNDFFGHGDAAVLYSMLRHLRPRRFLEVGSGFSSAIAMDVNEHHMDFTMHCTFIEPDNERLLYLMHGIDHEHVEIVPQRLQAIELDRFDELAAGDVLFVDSSHVAKIDSDVTRLFFDILPRLASGVVIHIHDILWPFEYHKEWVYEGRAWNEAYFLRAFLQYNQAFKVLFFNSYIHARYPDELAQSLPVAMKNPGGSFWLQKE